MTFPTLTACATLEELRAEFKKLVLKHHPDRGGDTETMKALNGAYSSETQRIIRGESAKSEREDGKAWSEKKQTYYADLNEKLRAVLEKLLVIDGIEVELRGFWFWIHGDEAVTRANKERFKEIGCSWHRNKGQWIYAGVPSKSRGKTSHESIKATYGSTTFKGGRKGSREELSA